jgi:phosphoglycolate phosphatase
VTRAVLLDLDGTLVDSAPAIIGAFRWVLDSRGIAPRVPLDASLIGPPLRDTLVRITGLESAEDIESLAAAFRARYDAVAGRATPAYPGMHDALDALRRGGFDLFVVTNKRIVPTRLILAGLGVDAAFRGIYAPDAVEPRARDKTELLGRVLAMNGLGADATVFVGDSDIDARAAAAHAVPFIAVRYGYGDPYAGGFPVVESIDRLADLPAVVARIIP